MLFTQSLQRKISELQMAKKKRSGQLRIFKNKFRLASNWYHYNRQKTHTYTLFALLVSHFKYNFNNNYLDYGPNIAFTNKWNETMIFNLSWMPFARMYIYICCGFGDLFIQIFDWEKERERASESTLQRLTHSIE